MNQIVLQKTPDGQAIMPSAVKFGDGRPRFVMPLLPDMIDRDVGVSYMVRHEMFHEGFERVTREVIDAHLQPDDVFVDIGAHWGIMTLSAVSRLPGKVQAIAVEPHPLNVQQLIRSVMANRLSEAVEIVPAAAGDKSGTARLAFNSTMGHSLLESATRSTSSLHLRVPVVSIDQLLADRPDIDGKRLIIKIDVEGFEPEVIAGARKALESGRVALMIWERGIDYRVPERFAAVERTVAWLSELGFRNCMLPYCDWAGPMIPLIPDIFMGNVFSFGPGVTPRPLYPQNFATRPPFNPSFRLTRTPERLAEVAEMVIAAHSSDGTRWADPQELLPGAQERAAAAAPSIAPRSSVLDLGCGVQALQSLLPPDCRYQPADLIPRSLLCQIADLNQGQFPPGRYDVIAMLEVLEYLHDVEGVLKSCRGAGEKLILTYVACLEGGDPAAVAARRRRGFVNDLTVGRLEAALAGAGWKIASRGSVAPDAMLLNCTAA